MVDNVLIKSVEGSSESQMSKSEQLSEKIVKDKEEKEVIDLVDGDVDLQMKEEPTKQSKSTSSRQTSYDVFLEFVKVIDGKENGEGIVTRACFKRWMETRQSSLRNPEEAFKRTIVSHIRGAYNRKPFPPNVEASLLKLLRRTHDDTGQQVNPWTACFDNDIEQILGKRPFKGVGYYEGKTLAQSQMRQMGSRDDISSFSSGSNINSMTDREEAMLTLKTGTTSRSGIEEVNELYNLAQAADSESSPPDFLTELALVLTSFNTKEQLEELIKSTNDAGLTLIPREATYFLQNKILSNDPRFDFGFLLPTNEKQRLFWPGRPVGLFSTDRVTWRVVQCDDAARTIFGRSIVGEHAYQIFESKLELLMVYMRTKPLLQLHGQSWHRLRIRKTNASSVGALINVKLNPTGRTLEQYIQEQPEVYEGKLADPLFV